MQPAPQEISTCSNCGGVLEETPGGGLGCMSCLLRAGIGSEEEVAQDSTPDAFEAGGRFGVYEIDRREDGSFYELGRGAIGVTYRATDTALQRKVALKIIKIDIAERSADARERFMREARAAAALRHENIATIHQFGMRLETGQYFYAMELIEGETIEERVRRAGPLEARTTIEIAQQVTSALAAAEKYGLVHRDLKPANLMLVSREGETDRVAPGTATQRRGYNAAQTPVAASLRRGTHQKHEKLLVKIIDFGLAKAIHTQTDPKSLTHDRFVGTPAFASPEQFEHSALDVRSDIYSLGETLWFALTGKTPFKGHSVEEIRRAQHSNALPIEQLKAAHVPSRLRSVLESMLALEPASRPGTQDLATRLHRCSPEAHQLRRKRVALAGAALLILGVSASFMFLSLRTQNSLSNLGAPEKSIAVLPFENLSEEKANAFFADGVQDEILTDLSKIADLKVISRLSVMHYRSGIERNPRKIGEELGVAHVLEGSVQRAGNRIRVNAQLIDARNDAHLWAQTYDRDLSDVFAIQSEIAKTIADQLQAKLSPQEQSAIQRPPTSDIAAFDLYTRARNLWLTAFPSSTGKDDLLQATDLLNQAVGRDPSFFDAWCQLAVTEVTIYFLGWDHSPARLAKAEAAVQTAGRLRPDAGETHLARGRLRYFGYLDYKGALAELELARRSIPNDPWVVLLKGYIKRRQGRWDESIRDQERGIELDPRNTLALQQLALTYESMRRYAEAKAVLARMLAFDPNDAVTRAFHAFVDFDWKAETAPLYRVIDSIRATNAAAVPTIANFWLLCALAERDAVAARDALMASGANPTNGISENMNFSRPFMEGLIARLMHDEEKARAAFTTARTQQEKTIQAQPDYAPAVCMLGLIDAALGQKEEGLREGQRAVELLPLEKDAFGGMEMVKYLSVIAAWAGDKDLACRQLVVATSHPSVLSYGQLKLLPFWDPLRRDPRFEKIVASLAPKNN